MKRINKNLGRKYEKYEVLTYLAIRKETTQTI